MKVILGSQSFKAREVEGSFIKGTLAIRFWCTMYRLYSLWSFFLHYPCLHWLWLQLHAGRGPYGYLDQVYNLLKECNEYYYMDSVISILITWSHLQCFSCYIFQTMYANWQGWLVAQESATISHPSAICGFMNHYSMTPKNSFRFPRGGTCILQSFEPGTRSWRNAKLYSCIC